MMSETQTCPPPGEKRNAEIWAMMGWRLSEDGHTYVQTTLPGCTSYRSPIPAFSSDPQTVGELLAYAIAEGWIVEIWGEHGTIYVKISVLDDDLGSGPSVPAALSEAVWRALKAREEANRGR